MSQNKKQGMPPKPKLEMKTVKRLLSYIKKDYKLIFSIVIVAILLSSVAGVAGSLFLEILIDDYILPLLAVDNPAFDGLLKAILIMAGIYLLGVIATLTYSQLMVIVAQGVLKKIRDEMFDHMQELSIKYFDTHSHGDLMSH